MFSIVNVFCTKNAIFIFQSHDNQYLTVNWAFNCVLIELFISMIIIIFRNIEWELSMMKEWLCVVSRITMIQFKFILFTSKQKKKQFINRVRECFLLRSCSTFFDLSSRSHRKYVFIIWFVSKFFFVRCLTTT